MDDLIAFTEARLAEDEAAANEVHKPRDCGCVDRDGEFDPRPIWCSCGYPARVLREVEADRALLAELKRAKAFNDHMFSSARPEGVAILDVPGQRVRAATQVLTLERVLKIRAGRFSDHPDYRDAWKPQ